MEKLKEYKNGKLYYNGYDLEEIALKEHTPLKITFLDIIRKRVQLLKESFDSSIKELNYQGKFIYLNANKANYGKEEIETAFLFSDGLETSSYYDLLLTEKLFKLHPEFKNKYLVCNGYKLHDYLDTIIKLHNEGYHIIDIIDSYEEYEYLKAKNLPIEIGLRIHLKALYSEDEVENDRFGLMDDEINKILDDLKNTKLVLFTIHYHQRGFDYEEDKYNENFFKAFNYYIKAQKLYPTVNYFDIGGGTPLPLSDDFNYSLWSKSLLELVMDVCKKNNVKVPSIISENGKYSQKDATINLYEVVAKKYTDAYPWYVVNSSLLIALPEMYALGEPIEVEPINNLDKEMVKARLAGITCDCDDVYFEKDKGYINLPKDGRLFIGLIGTGSYQNSMNGKGGVHHCLLPEERDIIVDLDGKIKLRKDLQSIDDICKLIKL